MNRVSVAVCGLLLNATGVAAQFPETTSPFLSAEHWSHPVLRRLEIAGLLPSGTDIARKSMPQEEVATLLEFAATGDSLGAAAVYLQRFREELAAVRGGALSRLDASVIGSYYASRDQLHAGIGYDTSWSGARPIADENDGDALVRAAWAINPLAMAVATTSDGLAELQLVLAAGGLGVWVGRRAIGYAPGQGGGIVINRDRLDGTGLFLTRPVRLPVLGQIRFEAHLGQVDNILNFNNDRRDVEAWLVAARGSLQPHPRLTIGVNRGIMLGGEGNLPVTAKRVFRTLIGSSNADDENSFANQVLSVDVRYRPPIGAVPLAVYLDWGTEDAAGAWWHVPAIVTGIEFSALPGRDLSIGIERTEFTRNRGRNSHWYQNAWFQGSWTDAGAILGHPLGGHGSEWRLFASGGAAQTLTTDVGAYRRHRRRNNLFAPERAGTSLGAVATANARLGSRLRLIVAAEVEHGSEADWTAASFRAGVRLGF